MTSRPEIAAMIVHDRVHLLNLHLRSVVCAGAGWRGCFPAALTVSAAQGSRGSATL